MSQSYCARCGTALLPGAAFCAQCGTPSPVAEPVQPYASPQQQPGYAPPPMAAQPPSRPAGMKTWQKWLIGIVGVLFLISGLRQMGIIPRRDGRASAPSSSSTILRHDWLVGTWSLGTGSTPCANWVRFEDNARVTDSAGNSGTWELVVYGTPNADLTMIFNGTRQTGRATRVGERVRIGSQEWSRVSC